MDVGQPDPTRLPRPVAFVVVGAIALAVALALASSIRTETSSPATGPTAVGVIRRQIDTPDSGGRVGAAAPDFEWNAPDGRTLRLADLRGKTVLLTFWATWCVPCREEMPLFDRVARADPDLIVLAIDLQEDGAAVRSFFDRYALTALRPVLDIDGATFRRYGVLSLPTNVFVDGAGMIRHIAIGGPMKEDAVRGALARARAAP